MQKGENVSAHEVCSCWPYAIDLDTWEYKHGLKYITASLLALNIGSEQHCQSGWTSLSISPFFSDKTWMYNRSLLVFISQT